MAIVNTTDVIATLAALQFWLQETPIRSVHFSHTLMPHPKIPDLHSPLRDISPFILSFILYSLCLSSPPLDPPSSDPLLAPPPLLLLHNPHARPLKKHDKQAPFHQIAGVMVPSPPYQRGETRAFNLSAGGNPPGLPHWNLSWTTKTRAINLQTSSCQRRRRLGI